jgi:exosortase A
MSIPRSARLDAAAVPAATSAGWRPALTLIGVALLIFALGFQRDAADAVRVWIGSTAYNHCFLVLPVVGYLLWERRSVISAAAPRPVLWPLALMPLLSAAWFVAAALDLHEGRQLLVVAMFEIVLLTALGPRLFCALLAPFLFLFFLVPSGAFLVPRLQTITAAIAVAGLRLFHVPVFSDGYLIDIPEGSFQIAEACAGLRFLIAAGVFSCLFAVVMYRSRWRRALYIALSVAAAIAANGVRAWGIIMLAHLLGSAAAAETDHILYGWLFFSLVIALLIGIGLSMAEQPDKTTPAQPPPDRHPTPHWRALAVPLAALIAAGGPAYAAWRESRVVVDPLPPVASPPVAAPWQVRPDGGVDWRPLLHGADREFLESFAGPASAAVTRYIALYQLRPMDNGLTSTENRVADGRRWTVVRQGRAPVVLAGRRLEVTRSEIAGGDRRRLVWSFYVVDGRIAAGLLEAKLLQLRALLRQRRPVGAFVAVAAGMDGTGQNPTTQLAGFLRASANLPDWLAALSRQPGSAAASRW